MSVTLFDTKFSLYCQLVRATMHENGVAFTSRYVDLPNGEQLEPWFARTNPKMLIPSVRLEDGTIVNESRDIMKLMDKRCPEEQEARVEAILDVAYSCDLGWFSTVAMKKRIWLWRLLQNSGAMESTVRRTIDKYADDNEDLREVYLAKLAQSERDVNSGYNLARGAPVQKCLDELAAILRDRKEGEWISGPAFTRADVVVGIYVRWALWQAGWDASLLTLDPILMEFYEEVKDRDCIVKTLDVNCQWVGFYWRDRLVPVQRAITGALLAVVGGVAYSLLCS